METEAVKYAVGDRIRYVNFYSYDPGGTVVAVTTGGYRIKWDDGYKDLPGSEGCYYDHELSKDLDVS